MATEHNGDTEDLGAMSLDQAFAHVRSGAGGLTRDEASTRVPVKRREKGEQSALLAYLAQFKSPILILLVFAAGLSAALGEMVDGVTILAIIVASSVLSFYQERQAGSAVKELLRSIATHYTVVRDGRNESATIEQIVEGDVVNLAAGSSIPGDGLAISSEGMLADESALTGESAPVEKMAGTPLYAGTHLQSGSGTMLVMRLGEATKFGAVAQHLRSARPESSFHQGVRRYGYLLMEFTLALTLGVFAANVLLHKPVIDSFLFSVALAVGLTPQLLPAIMSVTLARGARKMAESKVIVKRLEAIEDFGSMNVLCSDKTGTLTKGTMTLARALGPDGQDNQDVLFMARMNAVGTKGFDNPIDAALADGAPSDLLTHHESLGSIPYDFFRKRQSVLVRWEDSAMLITKGAVQSILDVCAADTNRDNADRLFQDLSNDGLRVLAVAFRRLEAPRALGPELEKEMTFAGFVAFEDPLRDDSARTVADLAQKGVALKLITGDNRHVASHVAAKVGLRCEETVTGTDLDGLTGPALAKKVRSVDVFAEVDPVQKERIILAYRKSGFIVGYIGDGINDGPALHAADVGLSVSSAVDVAKEAADFVMLERGLGVITAGVVEGRKIFANTMKYLFINTSAQFGNVFSMAAASIWLPFLPLLPKQILLNNFLTDIPAMSIAGDSVDEELAAKPRKWDIAAVRKFMVVFGLHSSIFDLLTFAVMLQWLRATEPTFHTGWFVESALSELMILLVIRTRNAFFRSVPGRPLLIASGICAALVALLPYSPLAKQLGLVHLPPMLMAALLLILVTYAGTGELLKRFAFGKAYPL